MDPTQVNITLSFAEIKSLCEFLVRSEGAPGFSDEGEVRLARHILGIIDRIFKEK